MELPNYDEYDSDVDWMFVAFMVVVGEAIKNDVDMHIVGKTANSIAATAAKKSLEEKVEDIQEDMEAT